MAKPLISDSEINEAVARKLGLDPTFNPKTKPNDYCHSIAAAWEVLGTLATKYVWSLHKMPIEWMMEFTPYPGTWKQTISAEADTAPMAICLAFLKL